MPRVPGATLSGSSHCWPCSQPGQSRPRPRPRPRPASPKQPRQAAQEHAGGPGREQQRPLPAALTRSAAAAGPGCRGGRAAPASWPLSPLEAALLLSSLPGRCRCCCPRRAAPARRSPAPAAPPAGCGAGSTALGYLVDLAAPCHVPPYRSTGGLVGVITEPALRERSPWPPAHSQTPAQACR